MVFKRLYRENLKQVYAASAGDAPLDEDLQKFRESMNILSLSPDQLKNFISANSLKKSKPGSAVHEVKAQMEEEIEKFEQELAQGEELNGQRIYKLLAEVIEDRLHLPQKV